MPLAQTRLRGLPANGIRRSRLSEFGEPSDELGLRLEHRSCCLVAAVAGSDSSRGLLFPTAHAGRKGPLVAGFACPLRSALRVWLPSRRFSPFHSRAGSVSHRQRSWDYALRSFLLPGRQARRFRLAETHLPLAAARAIGAEPRRPMHGSLGFWAFIRRGIPGETQRG